MKKVIAWMLVLALTAAVSIGATLAYLTDTDEDVNVMTLGKVKIDQLEYERIDVETKDDDATVQEFHDNKPLLPAVTEDGLDYAKPGDTYVDWEQIGKDGYTSPIWNPDLINNEVDKMVFVKNKGDYDAYVRSVFAFEAGKYTTLDEFNAKVHLNLNETDWTWEWISTPVTIGESTYFIATATYNKVLAPGALTEISLSQIALDSSATNEDVEAFGDTYQVLVKSQGIQAAGFTDPDTALDEGFGVIDANNAPWDTDSAIRGIDLRTALHYENGSTDKKITDKVTNVVFGRNKDYLNIVDNYDGTLVDVEQDVDVYSYYVNDGSTYTVYFLANDTIYSPKDSNGLFRDMVNVTAIDTGNFSVDRVATMRNMFRNCQKLKSLDTAAWGTDNVTDMAYMFLNCYALEQIIGSENWNTGNVQTMLQTFAFCKTMKQINASGWDVSNVTNMVGTFGQCFALEKVDTTGWKPVNVTTTQNMFYNCYALTEIVGSGGWTMPKITALNSMFQSCSSLAYVDVTEWDLSGAENMYSTFWKCTSLKEIDGSEHWNVGNVTNFQATFGFCNALEDLDVSTWDTGSATNMGSMFFDCYSLVNLDVANWDTGNVTTMQGMFSGNGHNTGEMSFVELPVENWDVSKVTTMNSMFYGCGQLTELDLSKWNTESVTNLRHVFADCFNLEHIDFTGWDTSNATTFDGMFNDCTSLKELDVSDFDTQNATSFHQFFEGCQSLTTIKGMENWDTSKVTDTSEMFNNNGKDMHLEYVDLSAFDTSGLTTTYSMFSGCTRLKTVYVGSGWDMSNVTNSGSMFGSCNSLVGGNGSTVAKLGATDASVAYVDTDETPGLLTHIQDKPAEEPTA